MEPTHVLRDVARVVLDAVRAAGVEGVPAPTMLGAATSRPGCGLLMYAQIEELLIHEGFVEKREGVLYARKQEGTV